MPISTSSYVSEKRALMQTILYSHTVVCLMNTVGRKMRLHISLQGSYFFLKSQIATKFHFSWHLKTQQRISLTTEFRPWLTHGSLWSFHLCQTSSDVKKLYVDNEALVRFICVSGWNAWSEKPSLKSFYFQCLPLCQGETLFWFIIRLFNKIISLKSSVVEIYSQFIW